MHISVDLPQPTLFLRPLTLVDLTYSVIASLILVLDALTFFLFELVFCYHILCVSVIQYDTSGQLYPTALKQLFTGIYVLELCLTGLFITIRNSDDGVAGIGQIVLISLAATATIIFYLTLENLFASVLKHLSASRDVECREIDRKYLVVGRSSYVQSRNLRLRDRLVAFCSLQSLSSISPSLRASIYEFARSQSRVQDRRVCNAMSVSQQISIISISEDSLELKNEKIMQARKRLKDLQFSTGLAKLDINGNLIISESVHFTDENWSNKL